VKVLDLFSGIGGFTLGLDSTGFFETVKFVEKDKYCQKVLRKNFPNIPIEEDIKNVKGKEGDADVIVGGFPCQPMSVAGKRKGTDDDRYLWPEMFRLIKQIKPQFVIGENVQGIINIQNGMVLRQVQDDLESEGFEVQCFLIPASGIGAWHQRYRVWIVAHSEQNGYLNSKRGVDEKKNRMEKEHGEKNSSSRKFVGTNSIRETNYRYEDVSNTERKRLEGLSKQSTTFSGQDSGTQFGSTNSSRSREEDVSNTNSNGEKWDKSEDRQGSRIKQGSKDDVSNTDSRMRRRWRTIGESGEDKVWRFYPEEEEQTRVDIRSETIGRDAVSGEETNALQSDDERREERDVSNKSEEQNIDSGRHDTNEQEQTWWQIESNVRGIPNGISYELDKDRANRIKTLGNAIVPQIARELGLAIKKVLYDNTDI